MHPDTIYTKTAKGVLEVKNKTIRLPRDLGLVFLAVDGKAKVTELPGKTAMAEAAVKTALSKLLADGYLKVLIEGGAAAKEDDDLDLDFTSPAKVAELNTEAEQRGKAEADAKARANAAARATAEAKAREETEGRA